MPSRQLVILTATIEPPADAHKLARADPAVRRLDYEVAWLHYLRTVAPHATLLFCENSGSDVAWFTQALDSALADNSLGSGIVSCNTNDFPPSYGRAYGEFKLLNYVASVVDVNAFDFIWKVTGRVIITNLRSLITTSPPATDLYCDCRRPISFPWTHSHGWMDMRAFGMSPRFFLKEIAGSYERMRHTDTGTPEVFLYNQLARWSETYRVKPRFRKTIWLSGNAGYDNKSFDSPRQQAIYRVRWLCRGLTPWIWI